MVWSIMSIASFLSHVGLAGFMGQIRRSHRRTSFYVFAHKAPMYCLSLSMERTPGKAMIEEFV